MKTLIRLAVFAYVVISSVFLVAYAGYVAWVSSANLAQFLLACVFFLLSMAIALLNIFSGYFYAFSLFSKPGAKPAALPKKLPLVAIAVPTCNEDSAMVSKTLAALKAIQYPKSKLELWVLDNSSEPEKQMQIKAAAKKHGFRYVYHERTKGFKSGSLNNLLKLTRAEYLAVFDSDEELVNPKFLLDNIGFFCKDEKLGFVQTIKAARPAGFFADSIECNYAFFYKHMQPVRDSAGIAMYSGSLGIIRLSCLRKVGGFQVSPPTPCEDTEFSFFADLAGYKGKFISKLYAYGAPVENFSTFLTQQWKYAYGIARMTKLYFANFGKVSNSKKHFLYTAHFVGFPYTSLLTIVFAALSAALVLSNLSFTLVSFSELVAVMYSPLEPLKSAPVLSGISSAMDLVGQYYKPGLPLYDLSPVIANVFNILILARFYYGSFSKGIMSVLLNVSLTFKRSEAALAASMHDLSEIVVTPKTKKLGIGLASAFELASTEAAYSLLFFGLTAFSLLRGDALGAFWLIWYGVIFGLALVFALLYK